MASDPTEPDEQTDDAVGAPVDADDGMAPLINNTGADADAGDGADAASG